MQIRELLNPISSSEANHTPSCQMQFPTQQASGQSRPKPRKDEPALRLQTARGVNFAPFDRIEDPEITSEVQRWGIWPAMSDIAQYCDRIPYHSEKKNFGSLTGRDAFEVFAYRFEFPEGIRRQERGPFWVTWDYQVGLVRITPFFKALGYQKTAPGRMLTANQGLQQITHSITGGALKGQGYWMPYRAAKAIAATFAYDIRHALVPLFGPDFPALCAVPPDILPAMSAMTTAVVVPPLPPAFATPAGPGPAAATATFPDYRIDPAIVRACEEETRSWLRRPDARLDHHRAGVVGDGSASSAPSSPVWPPSPPPRRRAAMRSRQRHIPPVIMDRVVAAAAEDEGGSATVGSSESTVESTGSTVRYAGRFAGDDEVTVIGGKDRDLERKRERGHAMDCPHPSSPGTCPSSTNLHHRRTPYSNPQRSNQTGRQQPQWGPSTACYTATREAARRMQTEFNVLQRHQHQQGEVLVGGAYSLHRPATEPLSAQTSRPRSPEDDEDEDLSPRSTPRAAAPRQAGAGAGASTLPSSPTAAATPLLPLPWAVDPTAPSPSYHHPRIMLALTPHHAPPLPLPLEKQPPLPTPMLLPRVFCPTPPPAARTPSMARRPEPPATPIATPERRKAAAVAVAAAAPASAGSPFGVSAAAGASGAQDWSPSGLPPPPPPLRLPVWDATRADEPAARPPTRVATAVDHGGRGDGWGLGIVAGADWRDRSRRPARSVGPEGDAVPANATVSGQKRKWEVYVADKMAAGDDEGPHVGARRLDLNAEAVAALILIAMSRGRTYVDEEEEVELIRRYLC